MNTTTIKSYDERKWVRVADVTSNTLRYLARRPPLGNERSDTGKINKVEIPKR